MKRPEKRQKLNDEEYIKILEQRLEMAEEKAKEQYQEKWDIINGLPTVEEIELIIYNTIVSEDMKALADGLPSGETNFPAIAQAIHKRLTEGEK